MRESPSKLLGLVLDELLDFLVAERSIDGGERVIVWVLFTRGSELWVERSKEGVATERGNAVVSGMSLVGLSPFPPENGPLFRRKEELVPGGEHRFWQRVSCGLDLWDGGPRRGKTRHG